MGGAGGTQTRLLSPSSTAAIILGAHDWTYAGLGRAPSFLRSARYVVRYRYDRAGLGLDPELVLDLFDDTSGAGDQLARVRETLDFLLRERRDAGRPVTDVLVYYIGHGYIDDQGHLSLLVRRSHRGMEAETGIKAPDLARALRVGAPQQRRSVILDCCFSEAAARAFIGMAGDLDQTVAAAVAKDLGDNQPARGTLLLCSSPVGEISMGPANAERTLFTGAVLEVLHRGAEGRPPYLSFADLRDEAYDRMLVSFGANAPRPVLHQANAAHGDLTHAPAFPNCATAHARAQTLSAEPPAPLKSTTPAPQSQPESAPSRVSGADQFVDKNAEPRSLVSEEQSPASSDPGSEEAARLRRLAGQGDASAQVNLGLLYENGRGGLPKDDREAARLYKLAADQGDAGGRANLGVFYRGGRGGLPKDDGEAARLFKLAADQGDAGGRANLGFFYESGRGGLPKDDGEAARLYRLAADQGNAWGQNNLGVYYEKGLGGLPKDDREAARLYRLAADQGNAPAQVNLGFFYENGRGGLPKDEREAARLYKLAADQGDAGGRANLGVFYRDGRGGLPKDDGEAARLYNLAADLGNASAQNNLGFFYENGRGGLPKDDGEAARLFKATPKNSRIRNLRFYWHRLFSGFPSARRASIS